MPFTDAQKPIQDLFDSAVARDIAPGFQFTVFDKNHLLVNGVSGHAKVSGESSEPVPMRAHHCHWIASASKIVVSIVALKILERGLGKNGMTLDDLDNHDKLVEILPEFKRGSGHLVTKIIEGFEPTLGADGRKIPVLHDVKRGITLRMLMTHTAGLTYDVFHPLTRELVESYPDFEISRNPNYHLSQYNPADGSLPIKQPMLSGLIDSFDIPLLQEPGVEFQYGVATDWLGQFIVRSTGKNLRALISEWILEPLGITPLECDAARTASIVEKEVPIHVKLPESNGFVPIPLPIYSEEGDPAPGYAHVASASMWSSVQTYSKLLQAVLKHDKRLLSEETWCLAEQDALGAIGAKVPVPLIKTAIPEQSNEVVYFSTPVDPEKSSSVNLLQCSLALGPTLSGRPAGAFGWAGLANTYYGIDPVNGVGWMCSAQVLPFFEDELVKLRDDFEKTIYQFIACN